MNKAFRDKPAFIDYDSVPLGESRLHRLDIIYDAFIEMCNRV